MHVSVVVDVVVDDDVVVVVAGDGDGDDDPPWKIEKGKIRVRGRDWNPTEKRRGWRVFDILVMEERERERGKRWERKRGRIYM